MAGLLGEIRRLNELGDRAIAEPFAGGGGASLSLLYLEETPQILINDADPGIHDFWWTIVNRPRPFMRLLAKTPVSVREWRRQRDVYRGTRRTSRLKRGFATFYLNRCNRSGIVLNGGPIGGLDQSGKWKIDARFNKKSLQLRCEKVSDYGERIEISCDDGIDFVRRLDSRQTFFFIDPPYYVKGPSLYLNSLDHNYHKRLARALRRMPKNSAWVLTYDDCPQIRELYAGWASLRPFSLRYVASTRQLGREVLVCPKWMRLPTTQGSAALRW